GAAILFVTPAFAQTTAPDTTGNSAGTADQPSSAPGVQGPPDTRTGPATRSPGDASGDSSSSGTSTGESGTNLKDNTTRPSQDSTGVEGMPGNKSGPAVKSPDSSTDKKY